MLQVAKPLMALPAQMLTLDCKWRQMPSFCAGQRRLGTLVLLLSDRYKHTGDTNTATLLRLICLLFTFGRRQNSN